MADGPRVNDTLADWMAGAGKDGHAPVETLNAFEDVLMERRRQILEEGNTPALDDATYGGARRGELAQAAGAYALHSAFPNVVGSLWPWPLASFKPRSHRENCIRAAALLLAEVEQIDRDAARARAAAEAEALAIVPADSAGEAEGPEGEIVHG